MGFLSFRRRRADTLPTDTLRRLVRRWLAPWPHLAPAEQELLLEYTDTLVHELRWETARGFTLTDDMRANVAAHASLLVLAFDDGLAGYRDVTSVIVHPSTIVRTGVHYLGNGIYADGDDPIIGEAFHRGPVMVSWDAAAFQSRNPQLGENVLLHEFAHRLDMLDGLSDGTPPLRDADAMAEWVEVCTRTLRVLRAREEPSVLRSYAATNPAEFFAVATEVFFTRPAALREENAALYAVLSDYFRQDPARRWPQPITP